MKAETVTPNCGLQPAPTAQFRAAMQRVRAVQVRLEHATRMFFSRSLFIRVPEVDLFIQREADLRELWYAENLTQPDCVDCVEVAVRTWIDSLCEVEP